MHIFKLVPIVCIFGLVTGDTWPELRTTFGINVFGEAFHSRPLTVDETIKEGWQLLDGGCEDNFLGNRYVDPDDPSLVLIYDAAGYICGVQSTLLKKDIADNVLLDNNPYYQSGDFKGEPAFFTTAYFVDPSLICTAGRSRAQFESQGLGDRLLFQNGPTADDHLVAPLTQEEAEADPAWYDHFCFLGMGDHFMQFNYQPDQDCFSVIPIQILYDDGVINGFVWQHIASLPGNKWEHPDEKAIQAIIDRPPTCLNTLANTVGLSTMHHYFRSMPWFTTCPLWRHHRSRVASYRRLMHQ